MQRENFYHKLRLIFTYYASQGSKQQPIMIREKNLQRFLIQSTLSEMLLLSSKRQSSLDSSPGKQTIRKVNNNKALQVMVNSHHKPLNFDQFTKTLIKVIQHYHHSSDKNNERASNIYEAEDDENQQKDLFDLCLNDKMLLNIFAFLYEQIEQGTQFGKVILFSQQKEHFNQDTFHFIIKNIQLIKTMYFHYFPQAERNQMNELQKIVNVLKKAFHQFEIMPQKLSLTEIFALLWQIVRSKSQSAYEKQFERLLSTKEQQIQQKEWPKFTFINFIKVLILCANMFALKNNDREEFKFRSENMIDFLQAVSISKGYKVLKLTYKLNECFFNNWRSSIYNNEKGGGSIMRQVPNQLMKFMIKPIQSPQEGISARFLLKLRTLLQLVFNPYTNNSNNKNIAKTSNLAIMPQKQFYFFCREFKLIPQVISKREIEDLYMRVFEERQFYQYRNNKKQSLQGLISLPQYGLQFQQFQKLLIYASQNNDSICNKFTSQERIIYLLEHIFSQQKFQQLLQKEVNQNRFTITKIDSSNPKLLMQKFLINNQQLLINFDKAHKQMYKKLKREHKK